MAYGLWYFQTLWANIHDIHDPINNTQPSAASQSPIPAPPVLPYLRDRLDGFVGNHHPSPRTGPTGLALPLMSELACPMF